MSLKTIPALLFFTVSAAIAAPAVAADYRFSVHKHELDTARGAENVYARITKTARQTCTSTGRRQLYLRRAEQECIGAIIEEIVVSVDHPRLRQTHAAAKTEGHYASR